MAFAHGLVDAIPAIVGLLIIAPFPRYPWLIYVVVGVVYTGFLLGFAYNDNAAPIFSKRNAKPLPVVLGTHLVFLAILMEFVWFAAYIEPSLPNWLTEVRIRRLDFSAFGALFILVIVVIGAIERRWIFVEDDTDSSKPDNTPE